LRSIKDLIKYDYRISLGNGESELYCSEGTLFVLKGIYEHVKLKPELIYGISVFPPSNVSKLGEVIFTNHPEG
jgi:hypothetical protein